jgi:regulator of protease activity HflC (stomatin/prohibitin superfamily)
MFFSATILPGERAVLLRHGVPLCGLGPGRHRRFGGGFSVERFDLKDPFVRASHDVRKVLPQEWIHEVTLREHERGIVRIDGRAVSFLHPGVTRLWAVDPALTVDVVSLDAPIPELTPDVRVVLPAGEIVEALVAPHERGVLFVDGRFERVLAPGMYAFWSPPRAPVHVLRVDMRQQEVAIAGQDLLTRDKVSLRLSIVADIRVVDPVVATTTVVSPRDAIYSATQLAVRGVVGAMTLDELLDAREVISKELTERLAEEATRFGLELVRVGLRDVVLPGEMKTVMNRVIEAEKESLANVIRRREETAAMRQLVNTARLVAENPMLMRMRELDTLKEIAGQLKDVHLVVGADKLEALFPRGMLGR